MGIRMLGMWSGTNKFSSCAEFCFWWEALRRDFDLQCFSYGPPLN